MILGRLQTFWEREGEAVPAGYQREFLTKRIVLDSEGRLVSVEKLSGEKRGAREGRSYLAPREQPQRTVAIRPRLVLDNPNYALGMAGPNDKHVTVAARHAAYKTLLQECYSATREPVIASILKWIDSGGPGAEECRSSIDADSDDLLFVVDGVVPTDLVSLQEFWARSEGGTQGLCLVSGQNGKLVDRMPFPIKNVPGGQTSGTMLVTVNKPSWESYGLKAGYNSPIGARSAEALCNGLNKLLAESKHRMRVGETVFLFWTREAVAFDDWSMLDRPDEARIASLLKSPKTGLGSVPVESKDFFVLSLTANKSRIVVRDYQELSLDKARESIKNWFENTRLYNPFGGTKFFSIYALAASLYRDASSEMPKHLPVTLIASALNDEKPLPRYLLALAAKRNIASQGPFETFKSVKRISVARLALTKAALLDSAKSFKEQDLISLNEESTNQAYNCGRLLSVLESIQRVAIPGLNATLVDRHYGSASVSPGVVFGPLLRDATSAHLPKLRKNSPGAFVALDRRLMTVLNQLGADFPKTLDFEDQGLFALGYYHQRASDIDEAKKTKELKGIVDEPASDDPNSQDS